MDLNILNDLRFIARGHVNGHNQRKRLILSTMKMIVGWTAAQAAHLNSAG
jgi:hypothetical protein